MSSIDPNEMSLVHFETLQQIEEIPGYARNIKPSEADFDDFIGWYDFSEKVPCQKSSCHKGHKFGFIIKFTDGRVSNIGNRCGAAFGRDRYILRRAHANKQIKRQQTLHALKKRKEIIESSPEILENAKLDAASIVDAQRSIKNTFSIPLFNLLKRKSSRQEYNVEAPRQLTKQDLEILRETRSSQGVEDNTRWETVGSLSGIEFICVEAGSIFHKKINEPFDRIKNLNLDGLATPALNKLSRDLESANSEIKYLSKIKDSIQIFFGTKENFYLLQSLTHSLRLDESLDVSPRISNYIFSRKM